MATGQQAGMVVRLRVRAGFFLPPGRGTRGARANPLGTEGIKRSVSELAGRKRGRGSCVVTAARSSSADDVGAGRLAFGFSAGGLLFPYFIGITSAFRDKGIILQDSTNLRIAGASAGSLVAAIQFTSELGGDDEVIARTKKLYKDLRVNGTNGRLAAVLADTMRELLPEDVHARMRNRCFVAVTQVQPEIRPLLLDAFSSKDDLIDGLLCSCFVPFWLDGRNAVREYRGSYCADGGLLNFIPCPPPLPPTQSEERLIRVSCFDTSSWPAFNDIEIHPGKRDGPPLFSGVERLRLAFTPGEDEVIDKLVDEGRRDALAWIENEKTEIT